jgi:ribonuclease D
MTYKFITSQAEVDSLLPKLMAKKTWGWDAETTGLDPHINEVILAVIGRPEEQYVIDTRKVSIEPLRPFFESEEHKKIGHNLKFDYKMFKGSFGIDVETMRCTYLASRIYDNGRRFNGHGLEDVLHRVLGVTIDKALQKSFIGHKGDFTGDQIRYAATDVTHLLPLAQKFSSMIQADNLQNVWLLECAVMPCFGDMEFAGVHFDVKGWQKVMETNLAEAEKCKKRLDEIAINVFQPDLFGNVDVNYRSPDQCLDSHQDQAGGHERQHH